MCIESTAMLTGIFCTNICTSTRSCFSIAARKNGHGSARMRGIQYRVSIDGTKAYADISLRSWVAVRFMAVQEVLAAHTMVTDDEVGGYVEGCAP